MTLQLHRVAYSVIDAWISLEFVLYRMSRNALCFIVLCPNYNALALFGLRQPVHSAIHLGCGLRRGASMLYECARHALIGEGRIPRVVPNLSRQRA